KVSVSLASLPPPRILSLLSGQPRRGGAAGRLRQSRLQPIRAQIAVAGHPPNERASLDSGPLPAAAIPRRSPPTTPIPLAKETMPSSCATSAGIPQSLERRDSCSGFRDWD